MNLLRTVLVSLALTIRLCLSHGNDVLWKVNVTSMEDSRLFEHPTSRIYGGQKIPDGQFTYAYASLLQQGGKHQCGGTFVAPDMILTAAHCLGWFDIIRVSDESMLGVAQSANDFEFSDIIQHPNFNDRTFDNDLMIVKLKSVVSSIEIVPMNKDDKVPLGVQDLVVVGWGEVRYQPGFPGYLNYAQVPYVDNASCEETTYQGKQLYQGEISSSMLCAGGNGVDACRGDSGSPLVQTSSDGHTLMGLVSWGRGCAIYPGVYTRISKFYDWTRAYICYLSFDPPVYLGCLDAERGAEAIAYSAVAPSSRPSQSPASLYVPEFQNTSAIDQYQLDNQDPITNGEKFPDSDSMRDQSPTRLRQEPSSKSTASMTEKFAMCPFHVVASFCFLLLVL